jgi:hypothetical protein
MSQPLSGQQKPVIKQTGDTFTLIDRGDWFVQEGPERPPRTALQWERQLGTGNWELVSAAAPLNERTPWELREAAEVFQQDGRWTGSLKVGFENVGRKIRARVAAGYGPSPGGEGDPRLFCEWGSNDGDKSGRTVWSNELVVQPWGESEEEEETGPTLLEAKTAALEDLTEGYDAAVRRGKTPAELQSTAVFQAIRLLQAPNALRDKLVAAMRAVR